MPTAPGVYIFKDTTPNILYVGKANNLKSRVRSYFSLPIRLGPKTALLVSQIASIDHIQVSSELEALLLESRLIKKFLPPFNIASRDDAFPYFIHISKEQFPMPIINHVSKSAIVGPFLNRLIPSRILRQLRRITPYCTSPRPVKRPCLHSHLGLCHPCPATGNLTAYLQNINHLKKLLRGRFSSVKSELTHHLKSASRTQKYEQAAEIKKSLDALESLLNSPISPDEFIVNPNLIQDKNLFAIESLKTFLPGDLHRIEFFDNAHLAGTHSTSAMTVAVDGEVTPHSFRHFSLHSSDDISMMKEVLTRRLKTDWPQPDLIVLDGGLPQHSHPGLQLLMRLRDAAHRFSRRLHHKHRNKSLLLAPLS
ncbi:GIY-YIG nuclease family protein [Candidatus Amesbacteria bacterium]|nr:GIY-YIG nuclease family protein [Candidatus Amesbacteria bacterium]